MSEFLTEEHTVSSPKHDITVELVGGDGNAFAIIGGVAKALRRAGLGDEAAAWSDYAMDAQSYDDLLQRAMRTVDVS